MLRRRQRPNPWGLDRLLGQQWGNMPHRLQPNLDFAKTA